MKTILLDALRVSKAPMELTQFIWAIKASLMGKLEAQVYAFDHIV